MGKTSDFYAVNRILIIKKNRGIKTWELHVSDNIVRHQLKLGVYKAGFYKVMHEYA